ncbi:hypothetical protein KCP71_11455 [Salmonella enterica subsp. enterica]|nr:hypothetical protein KCP71_11455 [Salmonella enterica subsp. enterica]
MVLASAIYRRQSFRSSWIATPRRWYDGRAVKATRFSIPALKRYRDAVIRSAVPGYRSYVTAMRFMSGRKAFATLSQESARSTGNILFKKKG